MNSFEDELSILYIITTVIKILNLSKFVQTKVDFEI